MIWSSRTPTRQGYYWYFSEEICDIVRVTRGFDGELIVTGTALFERHPVETLEGEWAGPIPVPSRDVYIPLPFR